jgi:hypothetical protein
MSIVTQDSMTEDFTYDETLYNMLNATVSPYETAALEDSAFYNFLFTPLAPTGEPMEMYGERRIDLRGPMTRLPEVVKDTTAVAVVVSDSVKALAAQYEALIESVRQDSITYAMSMRRIETKVDSARQSEIKKLAKIVDSMDPKSAAVMLSTRSSNEIQEVLFRVKPRIAAKILENMPGAKRGGFAEDIVRK